MNHSIPLKSIEAEREYRLATREIGAAEVVAMLEVALAPHAGTQLAARVRAAYEFASSIDYVHPGLSSASYLAHPVRVATVALRLLPTDADAVVLALLHNVFELSSVSAATIAATFGGGIADAITALTVDRTQKTREYTVRYYARLADMPRFVRVVKILDKLDNLFVLCLNPDEGVRSAYLDDIDAFIVPMVGRDLPELGAYLRELIDDCRIVGHQQGNAT